MARLSEEIQVFIIQWLASYRTPSQVADLVKEEFGVEIDRQQVYHYDPTKGKKPAKKWTELFEETRAKIREGVADIALTHKLVRVSYLEQMFYKAEKMKNYALAASLLEQVAKEMGESYTNTKHVDVTSGGETITGVVFTSPGSDDKD